jgi:hypothetical protein
MLRHGAAESSSRVSGSGRRAAAVIFIDLKYQSKSFVENWERNNSGASAASSRPSEKTGTDEMAQGSHRPWPESDQFAGFTTQKNL